MYHLLNGVGFDLISGMDQEFSVSSIKLLRLNLFVIYCVEIKCFLILQKSWCRGLFLSKVDSAHLLSIRLKSKALHH